SGREARDDPAAFGRALIEEAVVQAILTVVPKLDGRGHHPKAAPKRWAGHGTPRELAVEFGHALFELLPGRDGRALPARAGAELTAARPAREVGVGLGVAHALHATFHPDLLADARPVKAQG